MNKSGIYKIHCLLTNKTYIGSTSNFNKRKNQYRSNHIKGQVKIYNSIKKYGWENHKFETIEECPPECLNEREIFYKQHFVDQYGWDKALFCYIYDVSNFRGGKSYNEIYGEIRAQEIKLKQNKPKSSTVNMKWDEDRKKELSIVRKGIKRSDKIKNNIKKGRLGKSQPNISKAKKGIKFSEEHKQKLKKPKPEGFGSIVSKNRSKSIEVYDIFTKEKIIYSSLKETCLNFKISMGTVSRYIKNRKLYKEKYIFQLK